MDHCCHCAAPVLVQVITRHEGIIPQDVTKLGIKAATGTQPLDQDGSNGNIPCAVDSKDGDRHATVLEFG